MDAAPSAAASGKKRTAASREADKYDESPPSKAAKSTAGGDGEFSLDLGRSKRVQVSSFAGRLGVDIRMFFTKDGEELPGKGIRLSEEEWLSVKDNAGKIDAMPLLAEDAAEELALARGKVELAELFFVQVQDGWVDLRKYYLDKADGEKKPTKKGIQLTGENWAKLRQSFGEVDAALQQEMVSSKSTVKAEKQKAEMPKKEKKVDSTKKGKKQKSYNKMERAVDKLLEGKDLEQVTFGPFRKELRHELRLEEKSSEDRKGDRY